MRLLGLPCILDSEETAREAQADLALREYGIRVKAPSEKVEDGLLA